MAILTSIMAFTPILLRLKGRELSFNGYLREHEPGRITEALNKLYQDESSTVDEVLAELQNRVIGDDEW